MGAVIVFPASHRDRKVSAAFRASVGVHGEPPWDCDRGLHEPAFMLRTWACASCGKALSEGSA